jgi:hypothetical protein
MMAKEEVIEKVLDEFDFYRVKKVMDAIDWQWWDAAEGVPSIAELRRKARELLNYSFENYPTRLKTGGFCVENKDEVLSLSFELVEWEEYYGSEERDNW